MSIRGRSLLLAGVGFWVLTGPVPAQQVVLAEQAIRILGFNDGQMVRIDSGADYDAGGSGNDADITARRNDGSAVLLFTGANADLTLGGSNQDGDLYLRDDDGTTSTIHLDGRLGLLELGVAGEDGDIFVHDNAGVVTVWVDGQSGSAANVLDGNGLVKAWARINADGTVGSCYKCNQDAAETRALDAGTYEVDFTPLGEDIRSRPFLCSVTEIGQFNLGVNCDWRSGDASSLFVWTGTEHLEGVGPPRGFTVVIF